MTEQNAAAPVAAGPDLETVPDAGGAVVRPDDSASAGDVVATEDLVEEISIDGMCGVY